MEQSASRQNRGALRFAALVLGYLLLLGLLAFLFIKLFPRYEGAIALTAGGLWFVGMALVAGLQWREVKENQIVHRAMTGLLWTMGALAFVPMLGDLLCGKTHGITSTLMAAALTLALVFGSIFLGFGIGRWIDIRRLRRFDIGG